MAEPRMCRCGHVDFEHAGSTHGGNQCLGDDLACGCTGFVATPARAEGVTVLARRIADEHGIPLRSVLTVLAEVREFDAHATPAAVSETRTETYAHDCGCELCADHHEDAVRRATPAPEVTVTEAMVERGTAALQRLTMQPTATGPQDYVRAILTAALLGRTA